MREPRGRSVYPELRILVAEATRALALLDAERLQELALSCQTLNRDFEDGRREPGGEMARQARDAQPDMAVFGGVLEATRDNLAVMDRIRTLRRDAPVEYAGPALRSGIVHGND